MTEIIFILDKSGSMSGLEEDTIGGFNSFLNEQKALKDEANVSLFLFNENLKESFVSRNIENVFIISKNDYRVGGTTALIDAVGAVIDKMGNIYSEREKKPDNVIVCITTDGNENSSKEYTNKQIKEKIKHQEEKYNWKFMFFGANIDAFSAANSIGINFNNVVNYDYTSTGTTNIYTAFSSMVSDVRINGTLEKSATEYYNQKDN
jgi:uncharacterized protein YegL